MLRNHSFYPERIAFSDLNLVADFSFDRLKRLILLNILAHDVMETSPELFILSLTNSSEGVLVRLGLREANDYLSGSGKTENYPPLYCPYLIDYLFEDFLVIRGELQLYTNNVDAIEYSLFVVLPTKEGTGGFLAIPIREFWGFLLELHYEFHENSISLKETPIIQAKKVKFPNFVKDIHFLGDCPPVRVNNIIFKMAHLRCPGCGEHTFYAIIWKNLYRKATLCLLTDARKVRINRFKDPSLRGDIRQIFGATKKLSSLFREAKSACQGYEPRGV